MMLKYLLLGNSPKDVALRRPKTKQILDAEIKELGNNEVNQVRIIARCLFFCVVIL